MTGAARAPDSVRVAVTDSIDLADAPDARNAGERLVFDILSQPAARGDCPADTTGPYRADSGAPGVIYLRPPSGRRPTLIIRRAGDRAVLDLIDSGTDVVVTDRPTVIHYAKTRTDLDVVPMPWDRVYLLLAAEWPARAGGVLGAVRVEARPAEMPDWWAESSACALAPPPMPHARSRRIVYAGDDSVARGLAERVLAVDGVRASAVAPLSRAAFQRALAARDEAAYVVAVPVRVTSPCTERQRLGIRASSTGSDSGVFVPLVETRSTIIVRRGTAGLALDSVGALRIEATP